MGAPIRGNSPVGGETTDETRVRKHRSRAGGISGAGAHGMRSTRPANRSRSLRKTSRLAARISGQRLALP